MKSTEVKWKQILKFSNVKKSFVKHFTPSEFKISPNVFYKKKNATDLLNIYVYIHI